jgi:hypothetical protein
MVLLYGILVRNKKAELMQDRKSIRQGKYGGKEKSRARCSRVTHFVSSRGGRQGSGGGLLLYSKGREVKKRALTLVFMYASFYVYLASSPSDTTLQDTF